MNWFDGLAALGFLIMFPIPLYWLVLHPFASFWRRRGQRTGFATAILIAVAGVAGVFFFFGDRLFASAQLPLAYKVAGLVLLGAEVLMARQVVRMLGPERLIGKVEMEGSGQLMTSGIYAYLRHPSYAGMIGAMLGICLLAATPYLWAAAGVWLVLMLVMVAFEERELVARFGEPYRKYRARVPAFFPIPFRRRAN